jgi:hypothetical protein
MFQPGDKVQSGKGTKEHYMVGTIVKFDYRRMNGYIVEYDQNAAPGCVQWWPSGYQKWHRAISLTPVGKTAQTIANENQEYSIEWEISCQKRNKDHQL